jgi:hypothetical protein
MALNPNEPESSAEVLVSFGGKQGEIDASTFLRSLDCINKTLLELNAELGQGREIQVRIKALTPGSFEVHLAILSILASNLLQQVDWGTASTILKALVDILKLKDLLKKDVPLQIVEKDESVTVVAKSGANVTVERNTFNIYNSNVTIRRSMEENFRALKADPAIDSLSLQDTQKSTLVLIPRADFEELGTGEEIALPEDGYKTVTKLATVSIVKLVWDEKRKWEFVYRNGKISAAISDDSFLSRIDRGESFAKGDALEVELKITQELDPESQTFRDISYCISKVFKHIPRLKQERLNL